MAAGEDNKTFDLGVDLGGTKVAVCSSDFEKIDDVSERVMRFPSHITGSQEELVDTLFSSIDTYIASLPVSSSMEMARLSSFTST